MKLQELGLLLTAWAFGAAALLIISYGLLAYEQTLFTVWWWAMVILVSLFVVVTAPLFVGGLILIALDRLLFWMTDTLKGRTSEDMIEETVGLDEDE
jgi:hypothetical protein